MEHSSPYKASGSPVEHSPLSSALTNNPWSKSEADHRSIVLPSAEDRTRSIWSIPNHITTDKGFCDIKEIFHSNQNKCAFAADVNQSLEASINQTPFQQNNKLPELQKKYTSKEPRIPFCNYSVSKHNNVEEPSATTNNTPLIWESHNDNRPVRDFFSAPIHSENEWIDVPHLNKLEKNWPEERPFTDLSLHNPCQQQNKKEEIGNGLPFSNSATMQDQSTSMNSSIICGNFSLRDEHVAKAFAVNKELHQKVGGNYRNANDLKHCKSLTIRCSEFQKLSEAQTTKANSYQQLNNEVHQIRAATYASQSDSQHNFGQSWFGQTFKNLDENSSLMTSANCQSMQIEHKSMVQLRSSVPSTPVTQENECYQDFEVKNKGIFRSSASTKAQTETYIAGHVDSTLENHVGESVYDQSKFLPQQQREPRRSMPDNYSNCTYEPTPSLMYSKDIDVPSHCYDRNPITYFTAENCGSMDLLINPNPIIQNSHIPFPQPLPRGCYPHNLPQVRPPFFSQPQMIRLDRYNAPSYTDLRPCNDYFTSNQFRIPRTVSSEYGVPVFVPLDQTKRSVAPSLQLHHWLEACYEQWKALENQRKQIELEMGQWCVSDDRMTNTGPRLQFNPSRVDKLIVDQLREQVKVVALMRKMECLRSTPVHARIASSLNLHLEEIYNLNTARKNEIFNINLKSRQTPSNWNDQTDIIAIASSLSELYQTTRRVRTALWSALQMTLPKIPKTCPVMLDGVISTDSAITDVLIQE